MKNPFEELIKEVGKYEEDIDMVSREVESSENKAREINIAENKKTLFVTDKETEEVIIFKWEGETPITDEGIQDIFSNLPMIKREQSLRRMEAEQPPEKYIKNPTLYGIRGAEKAIMKDFVEPAVMIAGGASGTSLHPALGPVGTGVGLSAARKGTEWFEKELGEQPSNPSVMKNIIEGTVVGLAGELIPPVFSGIGKGTKAVINKVINILPAFTEKKAMQKVGNKLLKDLDIIDKDPLSKEAIKMAEEVMDTINGFTVPLAGQSGHPQLLQEFRAMIKSPGNASEKYAEQIVSNNQAIRNALNKTMTGNVDDLINVVNQRKDIMTGKIADLSTGVTKQQLGNKLVEPVIGLIPFNREIDKAAHKLAFKKIPNVPVPQQPITDIVDELKREITKVNAYKYPEDTIAAISDLLKKGKIEVVDPMGGKIVGEKIGFENWHERQSYKLNMWRVNCYAFWNGKHYIGDYSNGKIYEMKLNYYTEDGTTIIRKRRGPIFKDEDNRKNIIVHDLNIDMETGVGIASGQGSNPQAMLKWSNDSGHTWSSERLASIGKIGEYNKRLIFRRLGQGRGRIFELTISDPVKIALIDAYASAELLNN